MKLVWKGTYKRKEQLPAGELPAHAVKFREPDSVVALNIVAAVFIIPVFVVIGLAVFLKFRVMGHMVEISLFNKTLPEVPFKLQSN